MARANRGLKPGSRKPGEGRAEQEMDWGAARASGVGRAGRAEERGSDRSNEVNEECGAVCNHTNEWEV